MKEFAAEGGEPPLAAAAAAAAAAATCWAKMDLLMGATAAWMFVMCSCSEIVERAPRKSFPQCGHLDTSCEEAPVSGDKEEEKDIVNYYCKNRRWQLATTEITWENEVGLPAKN